MIIHAKIYKSLHYKDFIPRNVHPAKICAHYLDELNLGMHKKMRLTNTCKPLSAESEGFEPPNPLRSTVFKTAAINHSANSPSRMGLQI